MATKLTITTDGDALGLGADQVWTTTQNPGETTQELIDRHYRKIKITHINKGRLYPIFTLISELTEEGENQYEVLADATTLRFCDDNFSGNGGTEYDSYDGWSSGCFSYCDIEILTGTGICTPVTVLGHPDGVSGVTGCWTGFCSNRWFPGLGEYGTLLGGLEHDFLFVNAHQEDLELSYTGAVAVTGCCYQAASGYIDNACSGDDFHAPCPCGCAGC